MNKDFKRYSNGFIEGTIENYNLYVSMKKSFKKDNEEHFIDMSDITTFPMPKTKVRVRINHYPKEMIAVVGVTGISWLWDVKEDITDTWGAPTNEFISNGNSWRYLD